MNEITTFSTKSEELSIRNDFLHFFEEGTKFKTSSQRNPPLINNLNIWLGIKFEQAIVEVR